MKNKGFTLIELLAVITILALILLITFVSVSAIIKRSRNNLHDNQIVQIEKAAEYYNNNEGLKDEDICVNVDYLIENGYIKQDKIVDPKGGKKISGSVLISYNNKKYSYKYREKKCLCTAVGGENSKEPGTKYSCEEKDNTKFNFYVLSTNEDGTINLIMDRNICENGDPTDKDNNCTYAWDSESSNPDNGPVTIMTKLYNATKDWKNVPNMNFEYKNECIENPTDVENCGYREMNIKDGIVRILPKTGTYNVELISTTYNNPIKVRLPKYEEVKNVGCMELTEHVGSCPVWITENLRYYDVSSTSISNYTDKYSINNSNLVNQNILGYWLLPSDVNNTAYCIHNGGEIEHAYSIHHSVAFGGRPVITISTGDLTQQN